MPESQSFTGVSDEFLPICSPSDQPRARRPQLSPLLTRIHFEPNFSSKSSAHSSLSMKENIPPSAASVSGSTFFESPSYDSFFSAFQKPLGRSPMTYDDLWGSPSFISNQHPSPAISPTASRSSLPTFSSSGLSVSSRSSGSSPHDSSTLLLDSVMPYSSFGSPFTDILTDSINRVPLSPSKRKMLSERLSALPTPSTEFDEPDPKRIKINHLDLPTSDKLDKVFDLFRDLGWRTDTFLHHFFVKDDENPRSYRHSVFLGHFLNGKGQYFLADILSAWWASGDGDEFSETMFSVTTPYTEMKSVRPALSSFAAQIVEARLLQEACAAVHESSGLHASVTSKTQDGLVEWADLGASLMPTAQAALQMYQPLTFHYMCRIAEPKCRKRKGEIKMRSYRPPDLVSSNIRSACSYPSTLSGCHTSAISP
jgi:hypothetical protein